MMGFGYGGGGGGGQQSSYGEARPRMQFGGGQQGMNFGGRFGGQQGGMVGGMQRQPQSQAMPDQGMGSNRGMAQQSYMVAAPNQQQNYLADRQQMGSGMQRPQQDEPSQVETFSDMPASGRGMQMPQRMGGYGGGQMMNPQMGMQRMRFGGGQRGPMMGGQFGGQPVASMAMQAPQQTQMSGGGMMDSGFNQYIPQQNY